jgi:hypothetical protein
VQLAKAADMNVKQAAVVKRKTEEVQGMHKRLAEMTERKESAAAQVRFCRHRVSLPVT